MDKKLVYKIAAVISGLSGLIILAGVVIPIASYRFESGTKYPQLISPLPQGSLEKEAESLDYTKASNWFTGGVPKERFVSSNILFYTISIPKLKIENATVAVGGEDLSKSLIQYPGTALPGRPGNSVIFGHSVLPIFFNPKDYISIFSKLNTLKAGDEIDVAYDAVSYSYQVESMFEVLPSDIQVLEQDSSDSFLSLITCVPPGDPRKPKRLIVRARVVPPKEANADLGN
jgi:LPXTG-site transpeptidase (sortase) family protein